MEAKRMGILVSGGPAPGINSVISSITLKALDNKIEVIGFLEGYKHLVKGDLSKHIKLTINDVSRITPTGGSFLRTSLITPSCSREYLENALMVLRSLRIDYLVSIGGVHTADATMQVSRFAADNGYDLKTVHIPKTIHNDFPLPEGIITFGFESARSFGMQIVSILAEDSRSTRRWYLSVVKGGKTGHLPLGIGKSAAASLTLIPEDFEEECSLKMVVDTIVGAIFKRRLRSKKHGMIVVSDGLMELPGPAKIEIEEIVAWDRLLTKLQDKENHRIQKIRELLNDRLIAVIDSWKKGELLDLESMMEIIQGLNGIIQNTNLYQSIDMSHLKHCEKVRNLIEQRETLEEEGKEIPNSLKKRLNCLVICSTFYREISSGHFLGSKLPRDTLGNPLPGRVDLKTLLRLEIIDRLDEFGSYHLEQENITNWPDFIENIQKHDSPVKLKIWKMLNDEVRELIEKWNSSNPFPEKSRMKLINSLNKIIDSKEFYDHDLFKNVDLPDVVKVIIKKLEDQVAGDDRKIPPDYITRNLPVKLSENKMRMFNRMVMRAIFHREIAKLPKNRIVAKEMGDELSCVPPVSSDLEYTRNLGFSAVEFLMKGNSNEVIYIDANTCKTIPFRELFTTECGAKPIRKVNKDSVFYRIAREYMIKLEERDFEDPVRLKELSRIAGVTPERFKEEFYHVTDRT